MQKGTCPNQGGCNMIVTGQEWQAFLDSWPKGWWYDDSNELVDGEEWHGDVIPPTAKVSVSTGVIFKGADPSTATTADLLSEFRLWRKLQKVDVLVVEVPKDQREAFETFLSSVNGKVVQS